MHEDAHQPPPSPPPPPFSPNEAADEAELLEPGTFYKYDTRRVTFREYLFETKNPLVLTIAGIARLLRIRIPGGSTDDPNVEHLAPFEVAESAFPDDVRAQLAPLISELVSLGFHTPVFHEITDALHATRHHLVSFCHPSSHAVARVHLRVWRRFHPPRVYLFTEFITSFTDDTFLWSLSSKPDMIAPPNCRVNRHVGMSPTDLWKSHQHELAKEKGKSILTAHDRYELIDVLERHHAALRDFHLKRGVFVPLTDADRKQAATIQENERAVAASGMEHAEVLAEIEKLQNQRAGWGSAIFILVVSVFLFLGAGSRQWEWEYLLILMGVLFFHELGHYIAMRVFGYRNLRMFFIPFLGAAVSGRNYNVPGWKKVVVSLMGPVPGIILGAIIGMLGIILNRPQLVMVGIMSLILNGFNLLPVLPLDGGWVMHALLFSRHYLLDVAFRAIAAAVLLLGGFASGDRVLMIIGGITLLSLPMAYKLARLTTDLRRSGMQGVSPDDQTIPAPVAQTIISRVKEAFPKGVNNKMIAQHTLHVFETLNARPPGIAASIGLGIVHGGSFLAAILFVALLAIQQRGGLDAFRRLGSNPFPEPRYTLDPAAIREYRPVGAQPPADPASRVAVVATFDSRPTAQQHFDQLKSDISPGSLLLFGQSVFATIPADDDARRRQLLQRFQSTDKDAFVEHEQMRGLMQVVCVARNEADAKRIQDRLNDYFQLSRMHLIPPWSPEADDRTHQQYAAHERARHTYRKITDLYPNAFSDPALRALITESGKAQREGDPRRAKELREKHQQLAKDLRRREVEKLRESAATDPTLHVELIDRYLKIEGDAWDQDFFKRATAELGPLMGQVQMDGDNPAPGADRYNASGHVLAEGTKLRCFAISFTSTSDGAPAFARWLSTEGCSEFLYELRPANADLDDLEDLEESL